MTTGEDDAAASFVPHRPRLVALAYRMLGSVADAEDVVQDAYLRWHAADRAAVVHPGGFLAKIVTRLCLDRLKAARAQRERYVGTWLPEPVIDEPPPAPDTATEIAGDLTNALVLVLDRLSPLERAAFLLHDVFGMDFADVGEVLERNESTCRQLASRARDHVHQEKPRFAAPRDHAERLASAFFAAAAVGDVAGLTRVLAEDAVFYSDGGGKRRAALNPIYGRDKVIRFVLGVMGKRDIPPSLTPAWINGMPGLVARGPDGVETLAVEIHGEHIAAIYAVRNPDKLHHLA
jgi:RNA polymerase sigma-70 factor (ECF subfamily)